MLSSIADLSIYTLMLTLYERVTSHCLQIGQKNIGEIILARLSYESDRSEQKVDTGIERERVGEH